MTSVGTAPKTMLWLAGTHTVRVTGAWRLVWLPSPSWPPLLFPHPKRVPSGLSAKTLPLPAQTAWIPESPSTATALKRSVAVPSPNWP